jgi:hypothetical protein
MGTKKGGNMKGGFIIRSALALALLKYVKKE